MHFIKFDKKTSYSKNMKAQRLNHLKPDRLLIEVIGRYDWLFEKLVYFGEMHHGVSHFIIVSSEILKQKYQAMLTQKDSTVITTAELTSKLANVEWADDYDVVSTADFYEKKYEYRYLRDLMQQDRGVWRTKVPFAAATWGSGQAQNDYTVCDEINRSFNILERIFRDFRPKMLLVRPGWILLNVAIAIAEKNGVPCSMPRPARHRSFVTWTVGPYSHSAQLQKLFLGKSYEKAQQPTIERVQAPEGSRQVFAKFQTAYSLKGIARRFVIETYNHIYIFAKTILRGDLRTRPKYSVFLKRFFLEITTIRYLRRNWVEDAASIAGKKLLFLLPKEPEYTVQSLGRDFCNVHAILAHLAISLPIGTTLLVKEHSRVGYRRLDFYKELSRYDNVRFVNPFLPSSHYLSHCTAASTVAGTIALECCAMGKRCLTFANKMEYKFLPNIYYVKNLYDLPRIVDDVLEKPKKAEIATYKRAASKYYSILEETSFDAPGTKVFEGALPLDNNELKRAWDLLCINYRFQLNEWVERN